MSKPYLIMLPGWGMSTFVWDNINEFLCEHFELVFVEWNTINSLDGFKTEVLRVIEEKQLTSFSLLGWSLGSLVAQDIVVNNSYNIDSLILFGSTSCFVQHKTVEYPLGWNKRVVERMKFQLNNNMKETLLNFNLAMFSESEKEKELHKQFLEASNDKIEYKNLDSLMLGLDYLIAADLRSQLADIEVPLLMIHGEDDSICPLESALYIKNRVSNSYLEVIKHAGHIPFFTHPDDCCDSITKFIEENIYTKGT